MPSMPDRPNVLMICTDHWPGKMIGRLGHPSIQVGDAQNGSGIAVIPVNLAPVEEMLVASRLKEVLIGKA